MNGDNQLHDLFDRVEFHGEPPMASTAADDVRRGRRHLIRRRTAMVTSGAAGVAALAVGIVMVLPGGGSEPLDDLAVAGGGSATEAPAEPTTTPTATPSTAPAPWDEYSITMGLLLDTAVEYFDPAWQHLPAEISGFTGGGGGKGDVNVGTKLSWTNAGEDGEGMVQVAVTNPGYARSYDYARQDFAVNIGCDIDVTCLEHEVAGVDGTVYVAPADDETGPRLGVVYERADGSMVGVLVSHLFGNNTTIPVSEVDISLEQAIAFVTDPDLRVDEGEAADGIEAGAKGQNGEAEMSCPVDTANATHAPDVDVEECAAAEYEDSQQP